MYPTRLLVQLLVVISLLSFGSSTLTPSNKKRASGSNNSNNKKTKASAKEPKLNGGPQEQNVFERDLVQEEPSSRDIYTEHATYSKHTDVQQFSGTVLGYVTPVSRRITDLPVLDKICNIYLLVFFTVEQPWI